MLGIGIRGNDSTDNFIFPHVLEGFQDTIRTQDIGIAVRIDNLVDVRGFVHVDDVDSANHGILEFTIRNRDGHLVNHFNLFVVNAGTVNDRHIDLMGRLVIPKFKQGFYASRIVIGHRHLNLGIQIPGINILNFKFGNRSTRSILVFVDIIMVHVILDDNGRLIDILEFHGDGLDIFEARATLNSGIARNIPFTVGDLHIEREHVRSFIVQLVIAIHDNRITLHLERDRISRDNFELQMVKPAIAQGVRIRREDNTDRITILQILLRIQGKVFLRTGIIFVQFRNTRDCRGFVHVDDIDGTNYSILQPTIRNRNGHLVNRLHLFKVDLCAINNLHINLMGRIIIYNPEQRIYTRIIVIGHRHNNVVVQITSINILNFKFGNRSTRSILVFVDIVMILAIIDNDRRFIHVLENHVHRLRVRRTLTTRNRRNNRIANGIPFTAGNNHIKSKRFIRFVIKFCVVTYDNGVVAHCKRDILSNDGILQMAVFDTGIRICRTHNADRIAILHIFVGMQDKRRRNYRINQVLNIIDSRSLVYVDNIYLAN